MNPYRIIDWMMVPAFGVVICLGVAMLIEVIQDLMSTRRK